MDMEQVILLYCPLDKSQTFPNSRVFPLSPFPLCL